MQHLCFDIIYENGGHNGESDYLVGPFFVKMQIDEIKCRFTNIWFPRQFSHQNV